MADLRRDVRLDQPRVSRRVPVPRIDSETFGRFAEVFARFKGLAQGKTAVLISHRFSTVRMADRILVLENGGILEGGSHEELLALGGRYAELFELQAAGYR